MIDKVYQVVLYDTSFDHCYEYLDVHRTREGALRQIRDMGYREVHVTDSDEDTWYMKSDRYDEGGTYSFTEVYDESEALIREYELKD